MIRGEKYIIFMEILTEKNNSKNQKVSTVPPQKSWYIICTFFSCLYAESGKSYENNKDKYNQYTTRSQYLCLGDPYQPNAETELQ